MFQYAIHYIFHYTFTFHTHFSGTTHSHFTYISVGISIHILLDSSLNISVSISFYISLQISLSSLLSSSFRYWIHFSCWIAAPSVYSVTLTTLSITLPLSLCSPTHRPSVLFLPTCNISFTKIYLFCCSTNSHYLLTLPLHSVLHCDSPLACLPCAYLL